MLGCEQKCHTKVNIFFWWKFLGLPVNSLAIQFFFMVLLFSKMLGNFRICTSLMLLMIIVYLAQCCFIFWKKSSFLSKFFWKKNRLVRKSLLTNRCLWNRMSVSVNGNHFLHQIVAILLLLFYPLSQYSEKWPKMVTFILQ